jgi:hypothetical protein
VAIIDPVAPVVSTGEQHGPDRILFGPSCAGRGESHRAPTTMIAKYWLEMARDYRARAEGAIQEAAERAMASLEHGGGP